MTKRSRRTFIALTVTCFAALFAVLTIGVPQIGDFEHQADLEVFTITLGEGRRAWREMHSIIKDASPMPANRDGIPVGLTLLDVDAESFLGKIGFESGDMVQTIDGEEIITTAQCISAVREVKEKWKRRVHIELERNGERRRHLVKVTLF